MEKTRQIETEVVVVGAGPGGYAAAFRAADLGKKGVTEKDIHHNPTGIIKEYVEEHEIERAIDIVVRTVANKKNNKIYIIQKGSALPEITVTKQCVCAFLSRTFDF